MERWATRKSRELYHRGEKLCKKKGRLGGIETGRAFSPFFFLDSERAGDKKL